MFMLSRNAISGPSISGGDPEDMQVEEVDGSPSGRVTAIKFSNSTLSISDQTATVTSGGGVANLVEDTTPQLGGDLDFNNSYMYDAFNSITDADATPDISGGMAFVTANTGATTITDFDTSLTSGQFVFLKIGDSNTTVDFTASGLKGHGGVDWSPTANDYMMCQYDGTDFNCIVSRPTSFGSVVIGGFTASRAVESDASGNLESSAVTDTELSYLDGVTSAIQTQISNILDGTTAFTDINATDIIDSDNYAAASIDNEHLADNAAGVDEIATDAVTMDAVDADGTFTSLTGAWRTTGVLQGQVNVVEDTDGAASPTTDMYETIFEADHATATSDTTYTLPAAEIGMSACFYDNGVGTGGIVLDPNSADNFILDGLAMANDENLNSPGVAGDGANGDFICIVAINATTWATMGRSGDWVEATPP